MDWIKLAIPLIAVAVWILSNLASQQKETRRPPLPPPRPRDPLDPVGSGAKTKQADDNKYREEMDRARSKRPTTKPFPKPRPKRLEPAPRLPTPPLVLAPVPQPASRSRMPDKDQPSKAGPFAAAAGAARVEPVAKVSEPPVSAVKSSRVAIKNMLELFKTRDSLTTAFLLKEVLDLPLAKRPRRRL